MGWTGRNHFGLTIVSICVLFGGCAGWSQEDTFVISMWVDPVVPPADYDMRYKEVKDAGFTVLLAGFGATTPEDIEEQVDAAAKHGLYSIVSSAPGATNVSQLSDNKSPYFWGYQVKDEPIPADFPHLANYTQDIAAVRPGKLRFINLLPNYAAESITGPYEEYVSSFIDQVKPDVLCMDHYPDFQETPRSNKTRAGYRANLAVLRRQAAAHSIAFWNFFSTMSYGSYPDPSKAELYWQTMTSLAYGAKGVLYFCYWTPPGSTFAQGGAIMTPKGSAGNYVKGPHYYDAQEINTVLQNFGKYLVTATSTHVVYIPGNASAAQVQQLLQGSLVEDIKSFQAGVSGGDGVLIGQFTLKDGRKALLINNDNLAYNIWPTLKFQGGNMTEVMHRTGLEEPLLDDSPLMPGFQLALQAAQGRLIVFQS